MNYLKFAMMGVIIGLLICILYYSMKPIYVYVEVQQKPQSNTIDNIVPLQQRKTRLVWM
jgi:hypothetical protein